MKTLEAAGLRLEPLCAEHAPAMFSLLADAELYRHLDHGPPESVEALQKVYARLEARRSPDGTQRWLNWVLRDPRAGVLGYVQATVEPDASAWVAYVLGRRAWGRGHATAATRCMLDHLAREYGVRRALACVEQDNLKSIALLERLGFVPASADELRRHDLTPSERLFVVATIPA